MITVITPVHRLKYLNHCIQNFNNQSYQEKELVLILNGELKNICIDIDAVVLRSDARDLSVLRNIGLDWMAENNRKIFAFFDSDDWYAAGYLEEAINTLESSGAELVGKSSFNVVDCSGIYSFCTNSLADPTMVGYLSDRRFDETITKSSGQDQVFIKQHKTVSSSSENFYYLVNEESVQKRGIKFLINYCLLGSNLNNEDFLVTNDDEVVCKKGDQVDYNALSQIFN